MNDNVNKMNEALAALCEKYSVAARGTISMDDKGNWKLACSCGKGTFLLPWRTERKFVELKKFLDDKTLEDLSTLRFCTVKTGGCLKQQIARLNLCALGKKLSLEKGRYARQKIDFVDCLDSAVDLRRLGNRL